MMTRWLLVLCVCGLALGALSACGDGEGGLDASLPTATDPATLRTTGLGPVVGAVTPAGAHAWRGIPFAEPPVGELRWRAPRSATAWSGTLEALEHPPACPQYAGLVAGRDGAQPGELTGQEDCLYLNVFAPAWAPEAVPEGDARVPVLVWIHGGGNSIGDAAPYDGSVLAKEHGVVVVAMHYRLGPLGWLHHPALAHGGSAADASGNYGTLDQIEALRFVRDHISAFGGDPGNVTIFGESAGGRNVFTLVLSPLAGGLFHRAIAQSGSAGLTPTDEAGQAMGRGGPDNTSSRIVARLVPDASSGDLAAVAAALRETTSEQVFGAVTGEPQMGMVRSPQIFADGHVLPATTAPAALAAGHYNQVPFISGTNRDESRLFLFGDRELVRWWLGVPWGPRDPVAYARIADYTSHFWKLRAVDEPLRHMRAAQGPSVYGYRFDWDEEPRFLWLDFSELLGAAHALEIPFVFGGFRLGSATRFVFDEEGAESREELGRRMRSYWAQFARTGDPGRGVDGDLLRWEPWSTEPDADRMIVFDTEPDGGIRMTPEELTQPGLIGRIASDARFETADDRCRVLRDVRGPNGRLTETEIAAGGCTTGP